MPWEKASGYLENLPFSFLISYITSRSREKESALSPLPTFLSSRALQQKISTHSYRYVLRTNWPNRHCQPSHRSIFHPFEAINKTGQTLRTFDDWVALSAYIKRLIQTGVVNFDVISNQTLFAVILSEASHEQLQDLLKDWNFKVPT